MVRLRTSIAVLSDKIDIQDDVSVSSQYSVVPAAEKLTDFLARVSPAGELLFASHGSALWLDRSPEELAPGINLYSLILPSDHLLLQEALHMARVKGREELQARLLKADGNHVWAACRLVNLSPQTRDREILFAAWDISAFKAAEERLFHMANHDDLTGLANRSLLHKRILEAIRAAKEGDSGLAVLLLDLDDFKKVNNTLGHLAGDELLVEAAQRLRGCVRAGDVVARTGGDEFVVVLPGLRESDDVAMLAGKLLNALKRPYAVKGNTLYVGVSMGVALYPDHGRDEHLLIKHADTALYKAKELGKNRWHVFVPEGGTAVERRVRLEEALYDAVQNGEFTLVYQPLFCARTRKLRGIEALMRWHRPGHGPVSPAEFIPLAEDNGLINHLGRWSMRAACHQLAEWNRRWGTDLYASVNISPLQFRQERFKESIVETLKESGLSAEHLTLEITEGALMHDPKQIQGLLEFVRGLGVRISVDDFGTGYSSLAYLKRFPLSVLKIDRSFVNDLTIDPSDRAIISAIMGLAKELRLEVVAEGVETEEQFGILKSMGCDIIQGYLLGKPVSADELERKIEAGEWQPKRT